ncbi:uncharacterized protein N7483_006046 [Penicillium malachiteum]|uniref:uncharacterized protein n=1 Tax=Penicillium malachiteum TaxID=1324776 RepID=UPI002548C573|nr:uncharacterized protein N7483_006046 [Penicillium malachiteum]KAJ5731538.1 hypothetical protein N7483_006046 [Penicillium malachiteum]
MTQIHVVSKQDISEHATFTLPVSAELGELGPSSVRIRPQLVSLTSNNLTYATLGTLIKWWDAYPVQESCPAPYNDSSKWGIAPAWGFASVEETNIPNLAPETLLFGFWPTSAAPVDLKLEQSPPNGHWVETSEHRQTLMPLYNRFMVTPLSIPIHTLADPGAVSPVSVDVLDRLAWSSVFRAIWQCGHHLNEYVFPTNSQIQKGIHPLGSRFNLPWSEEDGDISSAVVVSLGASTKTARTFAYFFERREEAAPLGFLQVTSAVSALEEASKTAKPSFSSKAVTYADVTSGGVVQWMKQVEPSKVIFLEFGAREDVLPKFLDSFEQNGLDSVKPVIIKIGSPQKALTAEELGTASSEMTRLGKIQCNTSGMQDSAIDSLGVETFFQIISASWEELLNERHKWAPDMKIVWGHGISGDRGIEGGWTRLCRGEVGAEEALVYRLQSSAGRENLL